METKQSHDDDDSEDNSSHFIFNDTPPFQQATRKKYFWRNILSFISLTEQQRHEMKSFSTLLRDILPGLSYIYASFPHSKTKILTKLLSLVRRDKRVHDKLLIEIHVQPGHHRMDGRPSDFVGRGKKAGVNKTSMVIRKYILMCRFYCRTYYKRDDLLSNVFDTHMNLLPFFLIYSYHLFFFFDVCVCVCVGYGTILGVHTENRA